MRYRESNPTEKEQRILFGGVFVLSAQERDSLSLLISYFHSYCFV